MNLHVTFFTHAPRNHHLKIFAKPRSPLHHLTTTSTTLIALICALRNFDQTLFCYAFTSHHHPTTLHNISLSSHHHSTSFHHHHLTHTQNCAPTYTQTLKTLATTIPPTFTPIYTPPFYPHLHRLIHFSQHLILTHMKFSFTSFTQT